MAGRLAAIVWDLITWYYGIPTSSSHALVFGVLGAGVATAGVGVMVPDGVIKTGIGILYSPLIAFASAGAILVLRWLGPARAALGDAAAAGAWREGRAMALEQAIAYAVAGDES